MGHEGPWKRLGTGELLTQDADEGLGHYMDFRILLNNFIALLILTAVTVYTAKFVDLGQLNIVLALFLATVKATLVGVFFMHLKFEPKLIIAFAIYPLLVLFLLIFGTLGDVATRGTAFGPHTLEPVNSSLFKDHPTLKRKESKPEAAKH